MQEGFTVWLTGLSGAGKSTIAARLAEALRGRGRHVEVLDGDEVREQLSKGLGFSREDRDANIRRIGYVAKLLTRSGSAAIAAAISPYRETRDEVHAQVGSFVEVYVRCPFEELVRRDVKGLYEQALQGKISNFTGVSDPYEEPLAPDVVVDTDRESVDESVAKVIHHLEARDYLSGVVERRAPALALDEAGVQRLSGQLTQQTPQEVLRWAFETFPNDRLALATSLQIESVVLIDMAWRINPKVRVFTIDTGRLPAETHQVLEQVRERYGIDVEVYFPEAREVEQMVLGNGTNLFYQSVSQRLKCCEVRKVHVTQRVLAGLDAWITGLRRDQWTTRESIEAIEVDHGHGGIVKLNPLAQWTEDLVWDYARKWGVPVHPLYAQGYTSIGCAPCTRPTEPGEAPRAGRWWWEQDAPKECGMHCAIELVPAGAEPATTNGVLK